MAIAKERASERNLARCKNILEFNYIHMMRPRRIWRRKELGKEQKRKEKMVRDFITRLTRSLVEY